MTTNNHIEVLKQMRDKTFGDAGEYDALTAAIEAMEELDSLKGEGRGTVKQRLQRQIRTLKELETRDSSMNMANKEPEQLADCCRQQIDKALAEFGRAVRENIETVAEACRRIADSRGINL